MEGVSRQAGQSLPSTVYRPHEVAIDLDRDCALQQLDIDHYAIPRFFTGQNSFQSG
jgi:hypothetical protein